MNLFYLRTLMCLLSLSFLTPHSFGSELDTFCLEDLQGTNGFVATSGVIYSLPRTRLQVQIPLAMQRTVFASSTITPNPAASPSASSPVSSPASPSGSNTVTKYQVILDPAKQLQLTATFEDDPNLSFFLTCKDDWLVDATGGSIKFADNSTRLTHVGVTYQDQTIKTITAALTSIAQIAGTFVHATLLSTGTKELAGQEKPIVKTDLISGATVTAQADFSLTEGTWTRDKTKKDTRVVDLIEQLRQAQDRLVMLAQQQLKNGNDEPITEKNLKRLTSSAKLRITSKVVLDVRGHDMVRWISGRVDSEHYDDGKLSRLPGILYREPAPTDLQLELDEPYGNIPFHLRLPEAGIFGWVRISSEMFKTTGPSLDFSSDGSVSLFGFTSTSQVQDILTSVNTLNTAAKQLIDNAKTDLDKQRQAAATLELQKMKIANDIVIKRRDIDVLKQKLQTEADEKNKQNLRNQLSQAEYELATLLKRQEYLNEGITVPSGT